MLTLHDLSLTTGKFFSLIRQDFYHVRYSVVLLFSFQIFQTLKKEKLTTNKKNVDVNGNIREMKNSVARITQNWRIALFSLWSFCQSEAGKRGKKDVEMKRKIFFMIAKA